MAIVINGSGTITGISAGGLPDGSVTSDDIADNAVTADELSVSGDGTSGQALTSDGDGTFSWADVGGGFALSSYEEFTSSGTWNKSGNANVYEIHVVGGGGGGGCFNFNDSSSSAGGGGGGGGALLRIDAADLSNSYSVTVGSGGTNSGSQNNTANGNAGGASSFGSIVVANGGAGGIFSNNNTTNTRAAGGTGSVNVSGNYSKTESGQDGALMLSGGGVDNGVTGGGGLSGKGAQARAYLNTYTNVPATSSNAIYNYQLLTMTSGGGGSGSFVNQNGGAGVVRVLGYEE